MPTQTDTTLIAMANELREQLIAVGADPQDPPSEPMPDFMAEGLLIEYQDRGGTEYTDATALGAAIVQEVSHAHTD